MITILKLWIIFNMVILSAALARAKEFPVSDDDQKNIAIICRLAAKSPLVDDDLTANVARFCVEWRRKMEVAERADAPKEQPPAP